MTFRSKVHALRPDVAERLEGNEHKRKLALALRALRKKRGMTQKDVEAKAALSQPVISRLESPSGPLPNWDTVVRYVSACDGNILVSYSDHKIDEDSFVDDDEKSENKVIAEVAAVAL